MVSIEAIELQKLHYSLFKKRKSNKNKRYKCKNCNNSTTKNQLKKSNGKCFYCGQAINT